MRLLSFALLISILSSCAGGTEKKTASLSKDEMLKIVKECDLKFSIGVQKKDSAFLVGIYSDSAQYVTPQRPIMKGKTEIGKDWAGFLRMKEKPIDLILNIKEVHGTRDVIYETGTGFTLLADSTKWNFNYVNVWCLQKDGSYKLEIDTYN
jgi:ketosteroid isomerase-like protein